MKAKLASFPAAAAQKENAVPKMQTVNIMRLETNLPRSGEQSADGSVLNSSHGARGFSQNKNVVQVSAAAYPDATSLDSIESSRRQTSVEGIK